MQHHRFVVVLDGERLFEAGLQVLQGWFLDLQSSARDFLPLLYLKATGFENRLWRIKELVDQMGYGCWMTAGSWRVYCLVLTSGEERKESAQTKQAE